MFQRKHYLLAIIVAIAALLFGIRFLCDANHEFLIYVVVVVGAAILIAATYSQIRYPFACLVGLALWAVLHLAGGGIRIGDDVLYGLILIPISEKFPIIRYDQFVHAWGFGTSTLIMHHLLSNLIKPEDMKRFSVALVVILAGCGLGALNENIEFLLTVVLPQTGVGGYLNTSLDLCANLVGAVTACQLVRNGLISMKP